ncbi:ornithine carbamoyltransferase [uncultured Paludibaculum sp.]|uniref:ornithine carbamoyltransferase n=1 Tax=uncultured Paludibaculum sp. TaxID=1765020 RepID=UPI002AAB5968|nr:ornithine carbamoyltransferase [uncultured Paludibaculum sp.]
MTKPQPPLSLPRIAAGDLTSDLDLTVPELQTLLRLAADIKRHPGHYRTALSGRIISLLFEKPSLRTRITFEVAAKQLGGDAILNIGPIGGREPVADVARNLERWTDLIVARTFDQKTVDDLARFASIPVINALSDMYHPCQVLADMQTLREHWGCLENRKLAFVGDGNNVAHSLMLNAARLGLNFACIIPPGYEPNESIVAQAREFGKTTGADIQVTNDLDEGLKDANGVYTDVWASMGQEHEAAERARVFAPYQVNAGLMAKAAPGALFLHCLPAHREEEVTNQVIESPVSVIFDQAENRLHAQKALILMLLDGPAR